MPIGKPTLLTQSEVASVTRTSPSTVKRWVSDGELPKVKLGRIKTGRVRDNRPIRFRTTDVARLCGLTPEEIRAALADEQLTAVHS